MLHSALGSRICVTTWNTELPDEGAVTAHCALGSGQKRGINGTHALGLAATICGLRTCLTTDSKPRAV